MKKIIGLLSCLLMLASCNDGNVTSTGFNFDPAAPIVSCNLINDGLYYKTNGVEALILQTPSTAFDTVVTPAGQPKTVVIDNTNTLVVYRTFNAAVTDTYFCSAFPPSSPVVTSESIAKSGSPGQSGYLEITTTAAKTDTITHKITSFNHKVVFRNITFANSKSSFVYSSFNFGNYTTTRTP